MQCCTFSGKIGARGPALDAVDARGTQMAAKLKDHVRPPLRPREVLCTDGADVVLRDAPPQVLGAVLDAVAGAVAVVLECEHAATTVTVTCVPKPGQAAGPCCRPGTWAQTKGGRTRQRQEPKAITQQAKGKKVRTTALRTLTEAVTREWRKADMTEHCQICGFSFSLDGADGKPKKGGCWVRWKQARKCWGPLCHDCARPMTTKCMATQLVKPAPWRGSVSVLVKVECTNCRVEFRHQQTATLLYMQAKTCFQGPLCLTCRDKLFPAESGVAEPPDPYGDEPGDEHLDDPWQGETTEHCIEMVNMLQVNPCMEGGVHSCTPQQIMQANHMKQVGQADIDAKHRALVREQQDILDTCPTPMGQGGHDPPPRVHDTPPADGGGSPLVAQGSGAATGQEDCNACQHVPAGPPAGQGGHDPTHTADEVGALEAAWTHAAGAQEADLLLSLQLSSSILGQDHVLCVICHMEGAVRQGCTFCRRNVHCATSTPTAQCSTIVGESLACGDCSREALTLEDDAKRQCCGCNGKMYARLNHKCQGCRKYFHRGCAAMHNSCPRCAQHMETHFHQHNDAVSEVSSIAMPNLQPEECGGKNLASMDKWRKSVPQSPGALSAAGVDGDLPDGSGCDESDTDASDTDPGPCKRTRAARKPELQKLQDTWAASDADQGPLTRTRTSRKPGQKLQYTHIRWEEAGLCVMCQSQRVGPPDCPCGNCGWPLHRSCAIPHRDPPMDWGGCAAQGDPAMGWEGCGAQVCVPVFCHTEHAQRAPLRKCPYVWTARAGSCAPAAWPCM